MLILGNGNGDPISENDPIFAKIERKKMKIVIRDSGNKQIIVKTKKAVIGKEIFFLKPFFFRREDRHEELFFAVVFSAINEIDLILLSNGPRGYCYSLVNLPKYFFEEEGVGNILTFVEI
ncbi:MAG: hypothetical protein PHI66_03790 [Candidatus Pacebacteria bacterium]|nr:hypothetical protein [Candidatus Paceibacterota bacterium]